LGNAISWNTWRTNTTRCRWNGWRSILLTATKLERSSASKNRFSTRSEDTGSSVESGLREQEAIHLQSNDVDLRHGIIRVRSKPADGFRIKDREQRDVAISHVEGVKEKRPNVKMGACHGQRQAKQEDAAPVEATGQTCRSDL
jgi:hypothetical protein